MYGADEMDASTVMQERAYERGKKSGMVAQSESESRDRNTSRAAPNPDPRFICAQENVPACDTSDPAQLYAWFGNFGFYEHYRKAVLALCTQLVRSKGAPNGVKMTEEWIKNEARNHPNYLHFLADGLVGRTLYEREVRNSVYGRAA